MTTSSSTVRNPPSRGPRRGPRRNGVCHRRGRVLSSRDESRQEEPLLLPSRNVAWLARPRVGHVTGVRRSEGGGPPGARVHLLGAGRPDEAALRCARRSSRARGAPESSCAYPPRAQATQTRTPTTRSGSISWRCCGTSARACSAVAARSPAVRRDSCQLIACIAWHCASRAALQHARRTCRHEEGRTAVIKSSARGRDCNRYQSDGSDPWQSTPQPHGSRAAQHTVDAALKSSALRPAEGPAAPAQPPA